MIDPVVFFVLVLLIGIAVLILFQTKKPMVTRGRKKKASVPEERLRPCPLCSTMLRKGETVKTVIYPAKGDTLAEVFGCPYCYGDHPSAVRICPVCQKPVPDGGHVIGRMFKERRHLHVLGCTGCRRR